MNAITRLNNVAAPSKMGTEPLSMDTLRSIVPAAFATKPAAHVSSRYGFINSAEVIDVLRGEGYEVTKAQQLNTSRSLYRDPLTTNHMLVFQHTDFIGVPAKVGEVVPQVIFNNDHYGRGKARLRGGMFRFICANGLVVGDTTSEMTVRHLKSLVDQVMEATRKIGVQTTMTFQTIDRWKKIELSNAKVTEFAVAAAELRFGKSAGAYRPEDILTARRSEDEGNVLWSVFNRVQENTVQGGITGQNANGRAITSRGISNIHSTLDYNQDLWNLANKFAEAA